MSYLKIRQALENKVAAFAVTRSLTPIYENAACTPTTDYLKVTLIDPIVSDPTIGNQHQRYTGTLRLQFMSLGVAKGVKHLYEFADAAAAYFPRGMLLSKDDIDVRIVRTGNAKTPVYETKYVYITIDFVYQADVIN